MNLRRILAISSISVFAAAALVAPSLAAGNPNCTATDGDYIVTFTKGAVVSNEVRTIPGRAVTPKFMYDEAINGFAGFLTGDQVCVLQKRGNVTRVEADAEVSVSAVGSWGIDRIDQATGTDGAYSYTSTGSGVDVYVIDTGILGTHTEFTGRMKSGYSAIGNSKNTTDCNGHGTHVAGTIGGTTYGVAKSVYLIPVRVLDCTGSGRNSGVIAGINWAISNHSTRMAVANLSLGGGASTTLDDAIKNLIIDGVTVVVAAGNSKADACLSSPARVNAAITVGASNNQDGFASYRTWGSNWGTCVDVIAPGVDITSAVSSGTTATAIYSGTSMASPHVAGVAARILEKNPSFTPAQVASAIIAASTLGNITGPLNGTPNRLLYIAPGN
jgi:subtilisin family serine protease